MSLNAFIGKHNYPNDETLSKVLVVGQAQDSGGNYSRTSCGEEHRVEAWADAKRDESESRLQRGHRDSAIHKGRRETIPFSMRSPRNSGQRRPLPIRKDPKRMRLCRKL